MALCDISYFSRTLGMQTNMNVFVPRGKGPYSVLYLLHGLTGDYASWVKSMPLERYAERQRLMIVMPSGGRSYFCNETHPTALAWEDHMIHDMVKFVDRTFQTYPSREGRAIAGASMGGYGALMLALRHPDLFAAASSLSGSLYFAATPQPQGEKFQDNLANSLPKDQYNLFALATAVQAAGTAPAIRFDCGREDFLIECNRAFHEHLQGLGMAHTYEEFPGEHTWTFWDAHIGATLKFAEEHLKR